MIKLACVNVHAIEVQVFIASLVLLFLPLALIMMSYGLIVRAVVRLKSAQAWRKVLGTCGSHLTEVSIFFGTALVIYVQPNSSFSQTHGKFISLFYTVVTPTLNPLIYTLRNKDVMGISNSSAKRDFILVGFSDQPHLEKILFVLVLVSYLLTLVGNTIIILISSIDPKLKIPMYFFLTHLSLVDLCFTTSVVPQLLWNLRGPAKTITFLGCVVQLYISLLMGSVECVLLVAMAFDRYAAVCKPLHYATVMSPRVCKALAGVAWLCGIGNSLILCTVTLLLPRCGNRRIYNFFCEVPSMMKLACVDIHANEVQVFVASLVLLFLPLALIMMSYGLIVRAVVRLKSAQAWRKVLGTCGSHLTVVSIFFGTALVIYVQPNSYFSQTHGKFISLFYTVVTPTLNPLIYTLRNKDGMGITNSSVKEDFILVGFSDQPHLEKILFVLVLVSYLLTLVGNTVIILISSIDPKLKTPMYFFLTHLSLVDLVFTTSVIPQLLWNLRGPAKTITFLGCVVQLYVALAMGSAECVILVVMAFDRYAAVCKPLHYATVVNPKVCKALAGVAWLCGIGNSLIHCTVTLLLPRCGNRRIYDFVCEVPSMIKLACVDIHANEVQLFTTSLVLLFLPLALIVMSYGLIVRAVVRLKSAQAWRKVLGTCGSHLTVVSLFYGTALMIYGQPNSSFSQTHGKFISLFYTVVTPTLNPLIYTLRNKDVMGITNSSVKGDFILVGFSDQPHLEKILFGVVFVSYLLSLVGNMVIILISSIDPKLKTPMYFFLTHLSLADLCFTTSVVPQLLWNLRGPAKTITFLGCVVQLYVFLATGSAECVILVVMAFDRYAAVCKPLHYTTVMNPRVRKVLAGVAWLCGIGNLLIHCTVTLRLPRCGNRQIYNFFCEVPSMIKLACVDVHANEVQVFTTSLVLLYLPLALIMMSYGLIVRAVVRLKSAQAWRKVLGTCGSHLTVVSIFYGTALVIYGQPNSSFSQTHGKFISLFYTVVTPTLNPLIYTLRNKDVMDNPNSSVKGDFILVGFSDQPHLEKILFGVVLVSYLLSLLGNTVIILISSIDPKLKTPMYFFLTHLSLADLCFITSVVPQLLWNLRGPAKTITFLGCVVQLYVFLATGSAECVILVVMAFDRYAAVCKPLHYTTVMSPRVCKALAGVAWLCGIGNSLIHCTITILLPRCGNQRIYNFFCEVPSMMKLACVDVHAIEVQVFVASLVLLFSPLAMIVMSYGLIVRAVVRLKSAQAWCKVLGTCGSHLTVVSLFYGTGLMIYGQPNSSFSHIHGKFISLFYTVVTPTLNPLIYTLRNKDGMGNTNSSAKEDFILVGFSDQPRLEKILFGVVLLSYLLSLLGNTVIILISSIDPKLKTPMYFFLTHLSVVDIWFTTSVVPQLLWNLRGPAKTITFLGCVVQLYVALATGSIECVLLVVMAFDRYAAVCKPLHYTTVMSPRVRKALAGVAWLCGIGNSLIHCTVTLRLPRCGNQRIYNFFCEVPSMMKLACVDIHTTDVQVFVASLVLLFSPLAMIVMSYGLIVRAVVRLKSAQAWRKVLGTCGSHLTVVSLFYGTGLMIYGQPNSSFSHTHGKFISLSYTVVTPTLNPLIYTLRNKDGMGNTNSSAKEDFILVGFSDHPHREKILFGVVLLSYLLSLLGNTVIILISSIDPKLKTPMYFFLTHLSFVDICVTTSVVPQLLWNLRGPAKTITFLGCVVQLYMFLASGTAECVILVVMAFDRYAAVCKPLRYATVMSPRVCKALAGVVWLCGIGNSLIQSTVTLLLPRCGNQRIYNFFCEVPSMIKLACVDVHANEVQVFVASLVLLFFPLSLIVMSYGFIVRAVVRLKSAQAWRKVLGTCGSHLTVVSIFYGTALVIYGQPNSSFSHTHGKFISLFYTVVTPTLNPLIYTLRNKDVKGAVGRLFHIVTGSQDLKNGGVVVILFISVNAFEFLKPPSDYPSS
ncbi:Olfactory receptor 2G3 [Galemys pyrenaicus]|uniref:Olfactory receptor 2G3 n=1 Tax=Galemys pyrenaicus TaxID=202257 RepID=A0A8J5ZZZ0_GALPY|nr:Olfactory receptor 2G3 [Galemys pyrenaicus]